LIIIYFGNRSVDEVDDTMADIQEQMGIVFLFCFDYVECVFVCVTIDIHPFIIIIFNIDVAAEISTAISQPIGDAYAEDDDLEAVCIICRDKFCLCHMISVILLYFQSFFTNIFNMIGIGGFGARRS
jgi:hypothetical protein